MLGTETAEKPGAPGVGRAHGAAGHALALVEQVAHRNRLMGYGDTDEEHGLFEIGAFLRFDDNDLSLNSTDHKRPSLRPEP